MITFARARHGTLTSLVAASSSLFLALSGVAISAVSAEAATPQTIVSLTFDDSNADQVAPILAMNALGLHGTLYTVTGWIGTPGYQTMGNLASLNANGNEIAGHTVNHPDLTTQSISDQTQEVCQARATLTGWGYPQTSFAYPFASVNAATEKVVKDCGYNSARGLGDLQSRFGCAGCDYASTLPPADPYYTEALDEVDSTWTLADLQNGVINAENNGGGWVQFTFHHICNNACDSLSITPALFAQFTQWLAARGSSNNTIVRTVDQVIGGATKPVVPVTNSMAPAPGPGVNGIINPSLETAGAGGVPACWTASSFGTNSPAFSRVSPGHTGNVAEMVNMTAYTNGDAKLLPTMDLGDCAPTVTPGHSYSLRGFYSSSGPTQFEVYLRTDAGGWVYWTASPWIAASPLYSQGVWQTPAIPAGYNGLSFGLTAFQVGTITTDDYEMYDTVGAPTPLPTVTSGTPTISGIAQVGQTLSSDAGTWGPAPVSLAYQWLRNNAPIAGATSADYLLAGADAGQLISLRITGSKVGYNPAWATSGTSATIALGSLTAAVPTISGTAKVGLPVTADPGAWGPGVVSFAYQWMLNGVAIAGATSASYTPVGSDNGSTLTVAVTGTELGYTPATTTSAATAAIAKGDLLAPVPTISGTQQVGSTLTAVAGTWGPAGTELSYLWLRDGSPIIGATSTTYTPVPSDISAVITVAVSGSHLGYTSQTQTSLPAGQVALGTPTVGVPTISGTPAVGQQLTAATGTWGPGTMTFSYQWLRNGVAIGRAINPVYTLVGGDAGAIITVSVTGNQAGYTPGTAESAGTGIVASGTLTTQVPTITGTTQVGSTLTALPGSWGPGTVGLSYQWLRNGVPLSGQTSPSYTLVGADGGATISVTVLGTETGYTPASTTSFPTGAVALGDLATGTPTITGTAKVGITLTASTGTWGPGVVSFSYQWKWGGIAIAGATSASYTPVGADSGGMLTVAVTGTELGYSPATVTSAATAAVVEGVLVAPLPTITGTLALGSTLTAVPGTWEPTGTVLSFQWLRGGTPILGATSPTYLLAASDGGMVITVAVSGHQVGYTTATRTSTPVGAVALGTPTVGSPSISGVAQVGQKLTAVTGVWGPGTMTFGYQWLRNGTVITGAISPGYTLTVADLGAVIAVRVTGSQVGYTTATATSASTATVGIGTLSTHVPTITGTRRVGATLTAVPGIWGPGTVSLSYQWLRNGARVAGATSAQYALGASDLGTTLKVTVTGTEAGFATASTTSGATSAIALGILTAPTPTVTGTRMIGSVLTAVPGTWGPGTVSLSYQWLRSGAAIAGATSTTYSLVPADQHKVISVRVTGVKPAYATAARTSTAVGGILAPLSLPTLSLPANKPAVSSPVPAGTGMDPLPVIALLAVLAGGAVIGLRFWLRPSH